MVKAFLYKSPVGDIGVAEEDGAITGIFFGASVAPKSFVLEETELIKRAFAQLEEYFSGKRREFDLPLKLEGTDFEQAVWAQLMSIPYGQTRTYGEIARAIGKDKAFRAVGRANGLNPVSIVVPCHRVIGSGGRLTGYAGGLKNKEKLLKLEGIQIKK